MLDLQWIESTAATMLHAVVSRLPGQRPALLLEIIVWFMAVAGLGMLLYQLRAHSSRARPAGGRAYAARRLPSERRRWCNRLLVPEQGGGD